VQLPAEVKLSVEPETEQTLGVVDVKPTVKPEVAVALSDTGDAP
jgi:hypothetical protein